MDGVDPVRDHEGATTLLVTGDLMLVRGVPDPEAALAPMRQLLRGADLTVGNLESTLSTDGSPTQGGDSFGGTPALVPVLEDAGFDALSLANNHAGDYGERALRQTVGTLQQSRIRPFGAGDDLAEAAEPAVLSAPDGTTFAFLGFNAIGETPRADGETPGALSVRMPPRTGPLVEADLARVERAIRSAQRRADVVVVLPHWGTQYTHVPEPVQRTVARRLVAAGADLVVGGHPHWVQGVDAVAGVPVLHSLGNFVFDMDFMTADDGGSPARGDVLGCRAQGDPAAAVPDGRRRLRAAPHRGRRRPRRRVVDQHRPVRRLASGQLSRHAPRRAVRSSWAGSTTDGTSAAEWYAAYGVLPSRAPGSPSCTNDQWSLDFWSVSTSVGTPALRAAARSSSDRASGSYAEPTGTTSPTPTRSMATIPRRVRRSAPVSESTYAVEP